MWLLAIIMAAVGDARLAGDPPGGAGLAPPIGAVRLSISDAQWVIEPVTPRSNVARLLVTAGGAPLGWFWADSAGRFCRVREVEAFPEGVIRAWGVPGDLAARARGALPEGVATRAALDAVGPGGLRAWIRAGRRSGVQRGDWWWIRIAGQPAARFEAVDVDERLAFGRLTLLADVDLRAGAVFESWRPEPSGVLRTGVCYVDEASGRVWVALPGGFEARGQRVVFERDGLAIGRGVLERLDDRFGYVLPSSATPLEALRAGDGAKIFRAGQTSPLEGVAFVQDGVACVDVGEIDGLALGQTGRLWRGGDEVGDARVARLQASYCVVEPHGAGAIAARDRVVFEPRRPRVAAAVIREVIDGTIFVADVATASESAAPSWAASGIGMPWRRPLAIAGEEGVIGAGLVVEIEKNTGLGFGLDETLRRSLRPGDRLLIDRGD